MNAAAQTIDTTERWLLLIHQLPAKPAYLRVKVWRRLAEIGAVPVKNAVHALPLNAETQEDFEWLLKEILENGGEALICEARLIDGLSDQEVRALFNAARDLDYAALAEEIRPLSQGLASEDDHASARTQTKRWRKRLGEIVAIDFFGANGREPVEGLLSGLERGLAEADDEGDVMEKPAPLASLQNRVWVTRKGVHVDRIACAWLIRRFIDSAAQFKFVAAKGYAPLEGELRFDMFEAEFTHQGDCCSFEVLLAHCCFEDPALTAIAEIVHDIDLKDNKFEREEADGIARVIAGLAMNQREDLQRIERGTALFDDLYTYFRTKRR